MFGITAYDIFGTNDSFEVEKLGQDGLVGGSIPAQVRIWLL